MSGIVDGLPLLKWLAPLKCTYPTYGPLARHEGDSQTEPSFLVGPVDHSYAANCSGPKGLTSLY